MYRSIETWWCESAALWSNIIYIAEEQWEKLEKTCGKSALGIYLTNSSIPHCKPQQGLQKPVTSTGTYNKKTLLVLYTIAAESLYVLKYPPFYSVMAVYHIHFLTKTLYPLFT
jgi:hypothetical protein